MEIRIATNADLPQIAQLYRDNHRKTYRGLLSEAYFEKLTHEYCLKKWQQYLAQAERKVWVAYENAQFLGFTAAMADEALENTWYLDSLQVGENTRGKGVGTALIRTVGAYALAHGYKQMSICIVRGNDRAGRLYQKLGAEHFAYFQDDFCGTISDSEKLLWKDLSVFG